MPRLLWGWGPAGGTRTGRCGTCGCVVVCQGTRDGPGRLGIGSWLMLLRVQTGSVSACHSSKVPRSQLHARLSSRTQEVPKTRRLAFLTTRSRRDPDPGKTRLDEEKMRLEPDLGSDAIATLVYFLLFLDFSSDLFIPESSGILICLSQM